MVGLVGGSALVVFGALQKRDVTKESFNVELVGNAEVQKKSLILGVGLTGMNPLYIVWWLIVGLGLVVRVVEFGALLGVFIMYVSHVWMDYARLTGTAYLAVRGKTLLKARGYKFLLAGLAVLLIYFGAGFVASAAFQINILP